MGLIKKARTGLELRMDSMLKVTKEIIIEQLMPKLEDAKNLLGRKLKVSSSIEG